MTEQFCSLELCKRLEPILGDPNRGHYWVRPSRGDDFVDSFTAPHNRMGTLICKAYTLGELVEWCRGKGYEAEIKFSTEHADIALWNGDDWFLAPGSNPCVALAEAILSITESEGK